MNGHDTSTILVFGPWPDPRSSGISSLVHDMLRAFNAAGRDVLYLAEDQQRRPDEPENLQVMSVPAARPFDWREALASRVFVRDLDHLALADRLGALPGGADQLASVGVIHYHGDDFIPRGSDQQPDPVVNRYDRLAAHVAARAGVRPVIVRTRHEDVQGDLNRFMRLTGIDYVALPEAGKRAILSGQVDLAPTVAATVAAHRDTLRVTGFSDGDLDRALDHVYWAVGHWRLWRREQAEIDAVVHVTHRMRRECEEALLNDRLDRAHVVFNGSDFGPGSLTGFEQTLAGLHGRGLACHRGDGEEVERVGFGPDDRRVLFIGRPVHSKGIDELAEALAVLYHRHDRRIKGLYVGAFDRGVRRRLASVDPAAAGDFLLFPGYTQDPDRTAAYFAFGHVTAVASHADAFPMTGLESLNTGRTCVVTAGTSAAEPFLERPARDGTTIALAVDRPSTSGVARYHGVDVASLVRALETLLFDDDLSRRLAASGRAYAAQHYTGRRMGDDYLRLFDDLLATRDGNGS
jgi:glycosyltransferase involved in cell wall biosynthesis